MIEKILPIGALLIAVAIFFGYINPTYNNSIVKLQEQIGRYDSALVQANKFTQRETELRNQREAISPENLARLEAYLPDNVNNVQLILDLDALANRSGMKLTGFTITDPSADRKGAALDTPLHSATAIDYIDISVPATGTYTSFRTFLASAEHSLRPLDITNLSVTDSDTGVYTYTFTFRIYWLH
jgi:hypothetical protein